MILDENYTLSNGVQIPKLGLGTWFINDNDAAEAVRQAVAVGYRHIDTAEAYKNEAGVGEGVRTCGVPRDQIFVNTKVDADAKTYDKAMEKIDGSISKMGLDYLDMMIIHSPQPWSKWRKANRYFDENIEVWKALEDAYSEGKLKAIGVSNFLQDDLENILSHCKIKPMVNQILTHISNTSLDLIEFCQKNDILVEAYSPIAHGKVLKNEKIAAIAQKYNVTVAQLCIRYVLQLGAVALPKTANPIHMKENADVEFTISESDMEVLKNFEKIKSYGMMRIMPVFRGK
ncbi:MAG: aldo/keto reductase [Candidatus Methanomethylophilaceae archaeon]|nr:aldo/keto reductase [Candidatus Cloacimonadota bacterium]MCK9323513.1 aldo/keto reductase [Candidatus Methanomethylophilaceae archaeon]